MKKILFIFLLSILVLASCKTTQSSVPEDVVIADDPAPVEEEKEEVVVMDEEEINEEHVSNELYLPTDTSIRLTERGKVLETNPKIIFKFIETNMPATADTSFAKVIEFLNNNTNTTIVLEAHTSNRGKAYPYNYNLSVQRAKNGKTYLLERGIDSNRIIESPLGEALPEYPSQDDLRRYEFIIIESEEDMMTYNTYISKLDVKAESTYQGN